MGISDAIFAVYFYRASGRYGETEQTALVDPCLPVDMQDTVTYEDRTYYLRGTGNFRECREMQKPLLNQVRG